jgi:hypothetical protein
MPILIGAIYVWAFYGLVFAFGGLNLQGLPSFGLGVAFALGLARLAQRHPPKSLAWGVIGLNPGWGLLTFAMFEVFSQPDPSGEARINTTGTAFIGIMFGVAAALLSLGLLTKWGGSSVVPFIRGPWGFEKRKADNPQPVLTASPAQPSKRTWFSVILAYLRLIIEVWPRRGGFRWREGRFYVETGVSERSIRRKPQIVAGIVVSAFWASGIVLMFAASHPGFWRPNVQDSYTLLGLSVAAIVWTLFREETRKSVANA